MFVALGKHIARHPWRVIVVWALLVVCGAATSMWGFGQGNLFARMETTQFGIPGSQSMHVSDIDAERPQAVTAVVSGIDIAQLDEADTATVKDDISTLTDTLDSIPNVEKVVTPYTFDDDFTKADDAVQQIEQARAQLDAQEQQLQALGMPTDQITQARTELDEQDTKARDGLDQLQKARDMLIGEGEPSFVILAQFAEGLDTDTASETDRKTVEAVKVFADKLREDFPDAQVNVTSQEEIVDAILEQVEDDLLRGEGVSLPIALLILIFVFAGLIAATLPVAGALAAIAIGMGLLWAATWQTTVDTFVLNVVSIIGLALSIDYGLLIVSRYREEFSACLRKAGFSEDVEEVPHDELQGLVQRSIAATVASAGRTVIFSAVTIAVAIAGLLVMHSTTLRIVALGGVIVTLLAVLAASTLVPALITVFGLRILRPSPVSRIPLVRPIFRALSDTSTDEGAFSRLARFVQTRPWTIMLSILVVLIVLALPVSGLHLRSNVYEYIPETSSARAAYDMIDKDYPSLRTSDIVVIVEGDEAQAEQVRDYLADQSYTHYLGDMEEVSEGTWRIGLDLDVDDAVSAPVTDAVKDIRAHDFDGDVYVGGSAAIQYDFTSSLREDAPLALLIVGLAVLVLLFGLTGSLVVPIKAFVLNILSFLASLGVTVWIFSHGWLGLPEVPGLETIIVACAVAFGFGLSMDYEVFLIARMKEYYDKGCTNDESVAFGLQRSGRIITSAALAIIAVFIGFVTGNLLAIKEIGVLLAICVVIDATLVRLLLVPATMTVLRDWNWWAPAPLKRLWERYHIVH
ncbi:MAG: MMPL family transporter [Actinomycetaceae bacterium]|nr:MMPL family transporter [Actinomycetaceae bacterium]